MVCREKQNESKKENQTGPHLYACILSGRDSYTLARKALLYFHIHHHTRQTLDVTAYPFSALFGYGDGRDVGSNNIYIIQGLQLKWRRFENRVWKVCLCISKVYTHIVYFSINVVSGLAEYRKKKVFTNFVARS